MIDLHCHLLPGIDDGPETLEQALAMARLAVANGIRHAVVTPHIHPGRYDNDLATIRLSAEMFAAELQRHAIPLQLGFAAEIRISPEVLLLVESQGMPFLGAIDGYQIMLLEFPPGHIPPGSDKLAGWLLARNIRPMIAHPERNKDVIRDLDKIAPFVELGCLLQVTAGSLAGEFGEYAMERGCELLERGWVSILASDAHNLDGRPPALEAGRRVAESIVGEAASWALVRDIPALITGQRHAHA